MKSLVRPGDLDIIKQKLDYFAFNHYTRSRVHHDPDHPFEVGTVPPNREPRSPKWAGRSRPMRSAKR